jgi:hypothetical protein
MFIIHVTRLYRDEFCAIVAEEVFCCIYNQVSDAMPDEELQSSAEFKEISRVIRVEQELLILKLVIIRMLIWYYLGLLPWCRKNMLFTTWEVLNHL